jgi:hypothetical protein
MRSISRVCDVSINSVSKLLEDAGEVCAAFHDEHVRGVKAKRVQVDEIWSFTAAKQKNVAAMKKPIYGAGDTWTPLKPRQSSLSRIPSVTAIVTAPSGSWTMWRRALRTAFS